MVQGKQKERFVLLFADLFLICKPNTVATKIPYFKYELESGFTLAELNWKHDSKGLLHFKQN
jgi:hypothetical protein